MATFHDVMDGNARAGMKKGPKALKSIEHERGENDGHVFTHRFENSGGPGYHEPEIHPFGAGEDEKVLAHFAEHAGIKMAKPVSKVTGDEDDDNEKGESAAHRQRHEAPED